MASRDAIPVPGPGCPPFVLLDDARAEGAAAARLFVDPVEIAIARSAAEVPTLLAALEAAASRGLHVAGYLSYEAGKGLDLLSGERGKPFAKTARAYKAAGERWVVVGDENYGEGSSREHAAMSPRLLGCAAVIVRSFARIHESNLKKQGVLPLAFADPADYEKVRETDRVSVLGLAELAPGRALRAVFHHEDGSQDHAELRHTLSHEQIAWYRAGSALNLLRGARA